ncbi:MAG: hypothetical protein M1825_003355 [Sarcosagium campestre]|nr:MAG: hypothetical protein M1825_003355 [Sarcosagium campestre]
MAFSAVKDLSTLSILSLAVGALVTAVFIHRFLVWFRLREFSGPISGQFSKFFLIRAAVSGNVHLQLNWACEKYGNLARVGPQNLITNDPELWRHVNGVRNDYVKSDMYGALSFDARGKNILSETFEPRHKVLRQKMIGGFSGKEIPSLEKDLDTTILNLVALLKRKYLSTSKRLRVADLGPIIQYFASDFISLIDFGESFGYLAADEDLFDYQKQTKKSLKMICLFEYWPGLFKLMEARWIRPLWAPAMKDKVGLGRVMGYTQKIVSERFGDEKGFKNDMLGSFIRHGLSREEAECAAVLQVIAGSDTVAAGLRATMFYIITNPPVYRKLQEELDAAKGPNPAEDSVLSDAVIKQLPYLQGCIKEGVRLWPPLAGLKEKVVPAGGEYIDGRFIPAGTCIGIDMWGMLRLKSVFGEDADLFRPERWIEAKGEELKNMERVQDFAYGYGKWACLGKSIAITEMGKAMAELFYRFDLSITDPKDPITYRHCGVMVQTKFFTRISERGC